MTPRQGSPVVKFVFCLTLPLLATTVPLNKLGLGLPNHQHHIHPPYKDVTKFFRHPFNNYIFSDQQENNYIPSNPDQQQQQQNSPTSDHKQQQQQHQENNSDSDQQGNQNSKEEEEQQNNSNSNKKQQQQQHNSSANHKQVKEGLQEGFYSESCPQAEKIVNDVVNKNFRKDPTLAPAIIRLFSHDCLVVGCDASVLLDKTPTGEKVEKQTKQNELVRGFEVIDETKEKLEKECPGTVSCADILAYANRDSLVYTGVPKYNVAAGRRDSLSSLAKNVDGSLAYPDTPAQEIIRIFERKGLSLEELVVLIGAHSVGTAHCTLVSGRFFDPVKKKDMDPGYVAKMQTLITCANDTQVVALDPFSQNKMDSRYYSEPLKRQALLESDHNLAKVPEANSTMRKYVNDQKGWLEKFTKTIIKFGEIGVLTGNQGEIRKHCRAVN